MSCDFKPGDEVVCVASDPEYAMAGMPPPVVGETYTVAEVTPCLTGRMKRPTFGVYLAELPRSPTGWMYFAEHFRKVERRTDTLSIESFLTIKWGFEEPKRAPAKKRERA